MAQSKDQLSGKMARGGINDGFLGPVYQLKLVEEFACVATFSDFDFRLTTEDSIGGKFDDLIMQINACPKDQGPFPRFRLLQAKLKSSQKPLELFSLLHQRDFDLHKYFSSFLEIRGNFTNIQDLIIATSNTFQNIDGAQCASHKDHLVHKIKFIRIDEPDLFLGQIGVRYRLNSERNCKDGESTFQALKNFFISKELVDLIFSKSPVLPSSFPLLLAYRDFLMADVLDESTMEFKQEFLVKSGESKKDFKLAFKFVFSNAKSVIGKETMGSGNVWEFIAKNGQKYKQNLEQFFADNGSSKAVVIDDKAMDDLIMEFLGKFTLLLNAKDELIDQHIVETFKRRNVERASLYKAQLEVAIREWITGRAGVAKCIITQDDVNACLENVESSFDKNFLEVYKSEVVRKYEAVEFDPNSCLSFANSLLKTCNNFVCYLAAKSEAPIVSLKIIKTLLSRQNSFIYLKTSLSSEAFDQGLRNFTNIILIEIDSENAGGAFVNYQQKFYDVVASDPSKKLILVSADEQVIGPTSSACQFVHVDAVLCSDLAEESLKLLLNREISFQGHTVTLSDLIHPDQSLSTIKQCKLSDILNKSPIEDHLSAGQFEAECYIPRKVKRSINLKPEELEEEKLIDFSTRTTVISDVPGMGKSSMLTNLCRIIKSRRADFWVIKVDLNNYTDFFDNLVGQKMNIEEAVLNLFLNGMLKLQNDLDQVIFRHAVLESGNCFIILDGFDEVARDYKEIVLSTINFLIGQTKCFILVSTRPEWKETLEKEFHVFSYSINPFTEDDQKTFLVNNWKNQTNFGDDDLDDIAGTIMSVSQKTISKKDQLSTGIPLITKLLASYFLTNVLKSSDVSVQKDEIIRKLESENLSLSDLFESFIDGSFNRYLKEKVQLPDHNEKLRKIFIMVKQLLRDLHVRLAFKFIFNDDAVLSLLSAEFGTQMSDEEYDDLISCGLVYKFNDQFKFPHQTIPEHLVSTGFLKSLNNVNNAKFWLLNVLQKNGFQAIRSFINQSDKTRATEKDKKFYGRFILQNGESHNALHIAAKEGNGDLFEFLLGSVLSQKESSLIQIQNLLLSTDEKGSSLIYNYFRHCEITREFLDELLDLGGEFVKRLMMVKNNSDNSVIGATRHGENILKLLNWTLDNYSKDSEFLESVFGSMDSDANGLLFVAGQRLEMTSFLDLLDILVRYKQSADNSVISKILTQKNKEMKTFLVTLTEPWIADCIDEVLDRMKKLFNSKGDLAEFLKTTDSQNYSILHNFAHFRKKKIFPPLFSKLVKWIDREFSREFTEEILEASDRSGEIFLHFICWNDEENQFSDALIAILDFLKNEFCIDEMFLKKLIFKQAYYGGLSILHY
jgi:hypothetical protein